MNLNFIGGAFQGPAKDINFQLTVNLYVNIDQQERRKYLLGTPGAELVHTLDKSPVRALYKPTMDDMLYAIAGDSVYKIEQNQAPLEIGSIGTLTGPVSIADNGLEMAIVDGVKGYISDGSSVVEITDPNFIVADTVTYMDGYFIFNQRGGKSFFISNLNDGSSYLATDIQEAEGWPDKLISVLADHRELWLFGTESTEVWYNSGDVDFPFSRFQGGFTHLGCAAALTPRRIDNSVMWLSRNERGEGLIVRAGEGYRGKVVSPPQINWQIAQYERIDDAFAFAYQHEGHEFYQITFPSEDATWVFDASVPPDEAWFIRSTNLGDGLRRRHIANCHSFAYDTHYIGSYQDGKIYRQDPDVYTEDGIEMIRERIGSRINDNDNRVTIPGIQLVVEKGEPMTVAMRWSKDGGNRWGSFQDRVIGIGETLRRLVWRKLGEARDWLFHARITSSNKVVVKELVVPDK